MSDARREMEATIGIAVGDALKSRTGFFKGISYGAMCEVMEIIGCTALASIEEQNVVVPREATPEMVKFGSNYFDGRKQGRFYDLYTAMIQAAPLYAKEK